MENALIATGAAAGAVLAGYVVGAIVENGDSLISPFLGAMGGALAGGWISSRMVGN